MKHILNVADVELEHQSHGEKFELRGNSIGPLIGAQKLGASYNVVPPGKRAWPFHVHHINEEMFIILEGNGSVRIGDQQFPIKSGDVISAPPGNAKNAHQIINDSSNDLKYLAISTMISNEIVEYPDSQKIAVYSGHAPGESGAQDSFYFRGRLGPALEYWDGE